MNRDSCVLGSVSVAVGLMLGITVLAHGHRPRALALTPSEMSWTSQGPFAVPRMAQVNLVGNPLRPGPYTLRLKFAKGSRIAPHSHPDSREVTILSGVFATGYGETFDSAKLKILPAGSFYTEPSNVPHFIEIEEDAVLQVSSTGPSGLKLVNPFAPKMLSMSPERNVTHMSGTDRSKWRARHDSNARPSTSERGNTTFAASPRQRAAYHVGQLGFAIRFCQQQHAGVEAALMHDRVVGIA